MSSRLILLALICSGAFAAEPADKPPIDKASTTSSGKPSDKPELKVSRLTDMLAHGAPYQQAEAAQVLQVQGAAAASGGDSVLATTLAAIQARDWRLAALGVDTLAAIRPASLDACVAGIAKPLGGADQDERRSALRLAASLGPAGAPLASDIASLASDKLWSVDAIRALGAIGTVSDAVMPALQKALRGSDQATAVAAVHAFEHIGASSKETIPTLCALLDQDALRVQAAQALESLGQAAAAAVPRVLAAAAHANPADKRVLMKTLKSIETADMPPVAKDATATCAEGGALVIDLAIEDADDPQTKLKAVLAPAKPHGRVKLLSPRKLSYEAPWGFAGDDPIAWTPNDGTLDGATVTLLIGVSPDRAPPTLLHAVVVPGHPGQVHLVFSKPLAVATAGIAANYRFDHGVTVQSASASADGRAVDLATTGIDEAASYRLSLHGILDTAQTPNAAAAEPVAISGHPGAPGLSGSFFAGRDLSGKITDTTLSPCIDFAAGPLPDAKKPYSARWTGFLEAPSSEPYTFHLTSADGSRLFLDGQPVIDAWRDQKAKEVTATVTLTAHAIYSVTLEYFHGGDPPALTLAWSTKTMARCVVPSTSLFSAP